jgi:cell filamentation protein
MDPYVYPGTSVLRNLRGIRDPDLLDEFEADATSRRILQLERKPVSGGFDARHFQAIHRYIFQDVYPWAGEFRTVNIGKSGDPFAFSEHIVSSLDKLFGALQRERYVSGADLESFANRGAHYLGEINAVHPFRDGNGRTQRELIRALAIRNGYELNWTRVSQQRMIEASRQSLRVDNAGLEEVLKSALDTERNRRRGRDRGRGGMEL